LVLVSIMKKLINRHLGLVLCLIFFANPRLIAQSASESWSLEDCLGFGLSNHPSIRQTEGSELSAEARIGSTKSGLGVKLTAQSSFSRQKQDFSRARSNSKTGGSVDDMTDSNSESLSLRKVISDFGQTRQSIKASKSDLSAAKSNMVWQKIQVAAEIKNAFFRALKARALVEVQQDSLDLYKKHLEKVRGFVEVGNKPPYDITKAEVDVANAQVSFISAESDFKNAVFLLGNAVGYEGKIIPDDKWDTLKFPFENIEIDREKLLSEAVNRPDVQSYKFQIESTRYKMNQVKKSNDPTLSGGASYNWSGTVTPLDRDWNMSLSLSKPILDGQLSKYQIRDAEASIRISQAKFDQLKISVHTEVETAINDFQDAAKRTEAAEILVRQASEALFLAEGRYDAGVGSPIEVTDAQAGYSNARGSLVSAYFDRLIAITNLDSVVGKLPPEAITSQKGANVR